MYSLLVSNKKYLYILSGVAAFFVVIGINKVQNVAQDSFAIINTEPATLEATPIVSGMNTPEVSKAEIFTTQPDFYSVVSVVDGDTIKLDINGKVETLRLIGIDTPETVDPRKEVQCFGVEASNKARELLSGKKVKIETDATQGTYDKYNRLLGYVFTEDGLFYNQYMIKEGYAHEYTYNTPYKYQAKFKNLENEAQTSKSGLWSPDSCNGDTSKVISNHPASPTSEIYNTESNSSSCIIKGNISSKSERIFHVVGCKSYNQTVIDESKGEKWFCSEQEALNAGWRKALNCN